MSTTTLRNWDNHVSQAEEIARGSGFRTLRDQILALAEPGPSDQLVDVGAGTGLLTLAVADRVNRVWALDIAPSMCDYLRTKTASAGLENVEVGVASADSLPLVDASVDVVVSNYCLHHLDDDRKHQALAEVYRVLRPGGRIVIGDMMFALRPGNARDRRVVLSKIRAMIRKGPAGVARLTKNGVRLISRRWEHPSPASWWEQALVRAGFSDVLVHELEHEGGIAYGRKL